MKYDKPVKLFLRVKQNSKLQSHYHSSISAVTFSFPLNLRTDWDSWLMLLMTRITCVIEMNLYKFCKEKKETDV